MSELRRNGLGWRRDLPDARDLKLAPPTALSVPPSVDLRPKFAAWKVFDQGNLGSCTANAISAAIVFAEGFEGAKDKTPSTIPSRLQIYWHERQLEGSVESDAGAELRDGLKVVNKIGYYDESRWPYDVSKFKAAPPPVDKRPEHVYRNRRVNVALDEMKAALAHHKRPIIVGFTVYNSFWNQRGGVIPEPSGGVAGGHAVLCMGYDDNMTEVGGWTNCGS